MQVGIGGKRRSEQPQRLTHRQAIAHREGDVAAGNGTPHGAIVLLATQRRRMVEDDDACLVRGGEGDQALQGGDGRAGREAAVVEVDDGAVHAAPGGVDLGGLGTQHGEQVHVHSPEPGVILQFVRSRQPGVRFGGIRYPEYAPPGQQAQAVLNEHRHAGAHFLWTRPTRIFP